MHWVDLELVLVSLAAALSPTTLTFSVLAIVLSKRSLYTSVWFYLGALGATLAIGVAAAFVLGDAAASDHPSTPKTWVAILDVIAGLVLIVWIVRVLRRPVNPERQADAIDKMRTVASSPWIAVLAAGAALANPGVFIPIALKTISETDPSVGGYAVQWVVFTLVALLPLGLSIVLLLVAPAWAARILGRVRAWLELHARTIAAVLVLLLAASLLRSGIAGLAG